MIKTLIFLYFVVVVASFVDKNVFDYERQRLIKERSTLPPPQQPPSNDFRRRFGRSVQSGSRHPDDVLKIEYPIGEIGTQIPQYNDVKDDLTEGVVIANRVNVNKAWWKKFMEG